MLSDMALRATFIGIDRHQDPRIKELTGARRDAIALFSRFAETLPALDGTLLVDRGASHGRVAEVIEQSLSAATAEAVVIPSFYGHGTRAPRIVVFDKNLDDVVG